MNFYNPDMLKEHSVTLCYIHNGEIVTPGMMRASLSFQFQDSQNKRILNGISDVAGPFHEHNRNQTVQKILDVNKAEWTMWIDTDINYDSEHIYALICQAHPVLRPIVAGLYFGFPETLDSLAPIWYEDNGDNGFQVVRRLDGDPLQPIKAAGMGFCLIHTSVFRAMKPRIVEVDGVKGEDPWRWFGRDLWLHADGTVDRMGEDTTFFRRLWKEVEWQGKIGVPVYGHRGVVVKHRKARDLGLEDFLRQNSVAKERIADRVGLEADKESKNSGVRKLVLPSDPGFRL